MGTYGVYCGASGKNIIEEGEPVYLIRLKLRHYYEDTSISSMMNHCYGIISNEGAHLIFEPKGLPIKGNYDGYGRIISEDKVFEMKEETGMVVYGPVYDYLAAKDISKYIFEKSPNDHLRKRIKTFLGSRKVFDILMEPVHFVSTDNAEFIAELDKSIEDDKYDAYIAELEKLYVFILHMDLLGRFLMPTMAGFQANNAGILKEVSNLL
jgi:hypothetical protein